MGFALGANGGGEVFVQPDDRAAHVANGSLRLGFGREGIARLISVDFFEFPADFDFDRFGGALVLEDGFEFFDFPAQVRHTLGFVGAKAVLHDFGVAGQRLEFAGKRIGDQSLAPLIRELAEKGQRFEFESDAVDRLIGRVQQEIGGGVVRALLGRRGRGLAASEP